VEFEFVKRLKKIKKVQSFKDYYSWIGIECPDADALALRLRRAIDNSKEKRYHGSSEHMNQLPDLSE